jgi:hypothetical protein
MCPDCGERGVLCDPRCVVWLCTRCDPGKGRPFRISPEAAAAHVLEHIDRLGELEAYAERRIRPVPRVRG